MTGLDSTCLLGREVLRQREASGTEHAHLQKLAPREVATSAEVGPMVSKKVKHGSRCGWWMRLAFTATRSASGAIIAHEKEGLRPLAARVRFQTYVTGS